MRKALILAAAGLFLLLLSALVVVSPQEDTLTRRVEPPTMPPDAALAAMVLPDGALATQANNGTQSVRMDVQLDAPPAAGVVCQLQGRRDANGRVLTASRYVQSVYQVFRAEAAGG